MLAVLGGAASPSWGSARNGPIAYSFVEQREGPCPDCGDRAVRLPRSWIERVHPGGGPPARVPCTTGSFESCRDWGPVYTRDGRRLAVLGGSEIVIARPDGDIVRRIPVAASAVAWSPDGRRIAYIKSYTDSRRVVRHAVFVSRIGGPAEPVVPARDVEPFGLSWSPRGLLAWERTAGRRGVYVSRPGGGEPHRILPPQHLPRLPRWSYDGRRLAYACGAALCAARPDGSSRRVLTRRCNMEVDPGGGMAWSPDGRHAACTSFSGDLITVRLRDDKLTIVRPRPLSANFLPIDITWRSLPGTRTSAAAVPALATTQVDTRPRRPPCGSYPNTVIANAYARVFRIGFRRETIRRPEGFYVCDVRSRRLRYLGGYFPDEGGGTRLVRLAGRYVAYEDHSCYRIYCLHAITRVNVRSGHRRWFNEPPIGQSEADDALDLEVTARGNVVWIRAVTNPAAPRFDVVRWDGTEVAMLDSGPLDQIDPDSLAVGGGRAYWFAGGQARSAVID